MALEIPFVDGTYVLKNPKGDTSQATHQFGFYFDGTHTAGQITCRARGSGSEVFENIPDGVVSFAALTTVLFTFGAVEYEFIVSGATGDAENIFITDQILKV